MPRCRLLAALLLALPAFAQRHESALAVPVPGPVTLDGSLADWDLSAALDSAYDEALRPRFSARFALMYDAQALYVGAHFVDDTPLRNHHDPAVELARGWDGDCLQLRLNTDPTAAYPSPDGHGDNFVHVDLWYFTDQRQPVCKLDWGLDHHGAVAFTGADAGVVFRVDDDQRGYTLEARLPWTRLRATRAPRAGESLAGTLQPLWSDSTGWKQSCNFYELVRGAGFAYQTASVWGRLTLSPTGQLEPTQRPRSVAETLAPLALAVALPDPAATSVSLALYDADGTLVRTLPVASGGAPTLDLRWDGLDDDGQPLPAGDYTLRLLSHRGLGQRWVTSLHNAGQPPWHTDDGTGAWGGDHGAPLAACSDSRRVYLGWELSEAGTAIIAVDPVSRKKLWGQGTVLEIGMLAQALASDGERLFVAQDGRRWGQGAGGKNTAGVVLWDAATGKPVNFPFGRRCLVVSEYDPGADESPNLVGLAVQGDRLFASLKREQRLVEFDWRTGRQVGERALPSPRGLGWAPGGRLLALSGTSLVVLPAGGGAPRALVTGLSDPHSVAVGADGQLFVSDRGSAQQIKVFAPDGQRCPALGVPGGRPALGRYNPLGLYQPAGLTVAPNGLLWVTEQDHTPKRVSVWRPSGQLEADLLGPGAYAVEAAADPAQPRLLLTHNTLFEVDYATGANRCLATVVRGAPGQLQPFGGMMGRGLRFAHVDGRTYLVWPGHGLALIYRLGDDLVARPVAAVGYLKDAPLYGLKPEMLPPAQRALVGPERFNALFRWSDRNGDGLVQPDEVDAAKVPQTYHGYWGPWVEPDLTLWFPGASSGAWRLPVERWLPGGVPVYPAPGEQHPALATRGECVHALPGAGGTYVLERRGGNVQTAAGAQWMAVSSYRPDGTRRWAYRRTWTDFALEAPLFKPGYVIGAMKFIGTARLDDGHELVAVNGYFGQFNLLDDDGLWVGALCHDNRYGPKADATTIWPENFSGWFYRHRDDGKVYLLAGDTDARLWELTGLETLRRASRTVTLTAADHALAVAAAAQRGSSAAGAAAIAVRRNADGWDATPACQVDAGGGRGFGAALAYDAQRLYATFDVRDPAKLANNGQDFALLFKTGGTCELMLAADPAADPRRTRPVAGDQRLVVALLGGQPVVVLYQPVGPAGADARTFSSPTGNEVCARVVRLASATVTWTPRADGCRVAVSVPLAELGLHLTPGTRLRGDIGVLFPDAGGSRTAYRAYRFNQQTAIVNDLPSEARLTPAHWGTLNAE